MWYAVPFQRRNGLITAYTIYYRWKGNASNVTLRPGIYTANITGLVQDTEYLVSVSASTSAGEGPKCKEVTMKTESEFTCPK